MIWRTARPRPKVVIIGGSNSVYSMPWPQAFARMAGEGFPVLNRSIGGVSTLTGLYRLFTTPDLRPGDVVVWEYAINDYMHHQSGQPLPVLMMHMDLFLRHCAEAKVTALPLLLQTRGKFDSDAPDAYTMALDAMLQQRCLDVADCRRTAMAAADLPAKADDIYEDGLHYRRDIAFVDRMAALVLDKARHKLGKKPAPAMPFPDLAGRQIVVSHDFGDSEPVELTNSLFSGSVHAVGRGLRCRARGHVIGIILKATEGGHAVAIRSGRRVMGRFSTFAKIHGKPMKWQLKQISPDAESFPIPFHANGTLIFERPRKGEPITAQYAMRQVAVAPNPPDDGIIAVMTLQRRQKRRVTHPLIRLARAMLPGPVKSVLRALRERLHRS